MFVDWKSFPYRSSEIIEWYKRVQKASAFYNSKNITDATGALTCIKKLTPITHIIVKAEREDLLRAANAEPIHLDYKYVIAKLKRNLEVKQPNTIDR